MLGDDSVNARRKFIELKEEYKNNKFEIYDLTISSLAELPKWLYQSQGLFETQKVFFGENLTSKKELREELKKYGEAIHDIILFEDKLEERSAKTYFPKAQLFTYKFPTTIFKLLDALYPSNIKTVITYINQLRDTVDENILFFMISKRIRELLLVKQNLSLSSKVASWQVQQLKTQAKHWDLKNLTRCYESLFKIDVQNKTSSTHYSISQALDILFCYFVR